jgi:hypothetical protein
MSRLPVRTIVLGIIVILLIGVNVYPFKSTQEPACDGIFATDTVRHHSFGFPFRYLQVGGSSDGPECISRRSDGTPAKPKRTFLIQSLVGDVLLGGLVLIGAQILLDPKTRKHEN